MEQSYFGKNCYGALLKKLTLGSALFVAFLVIVNPVFNVFLLRLGLPVPSFLDERGVSACVVFVSLACIFVCLAHRKMDLFLGSICVLCALIVVSTVYNGGDLVIALVDWLPCLAVSMLVALLAEKRVKLLLSVFFGACVLYLLGNLVFLLAGHDLFRFDSVDNYPFGYRNVTFRIAIPACACAFVLDALEEEAVSLRTITVYMVALVEVLVGYSATSACALAMMGVLLLVVKTWNCAKVLNAVSYLGCYVLSFVGLVVLRVQNVFGFIIEPILHRTVTLTGRTDLWDAAFSHLSNLHLLYGYGTGYMWNTLLLNGTPEKHAHNDALHLLMLGGVGALVALALAVLLSVRRLYIERRDAVAIGLSIGLSGFFLVSIVEVAACPGFFFLLAVSYYYPYFHAADERA